MNIVIVGGGTAGWLTALYAKKIFSNENIILIESEDIGILGAGEGSTPHMIELMRFLEIPFAKLFTECKVTIKNSIKFINWASNNDEYHHPFYSQTKASNDINYVLNRYSEFDTGFSHIISSKFNHELKDYSLVQKLSIQKKTPFFFVDDKINEIANWGIHFDAVLLAKFLRKLGEDRGIIRKEGVVEEIICDENENIKNLKINKETVLTDFVFDCTGFKRLIIGNFYKSSWKKHKLPAKKAIPFFLPPSEKLSPYTESISMNYGWVWKIPLQHRYGCGYVFDSDFITPEDAKKEVDSLLGFEVESPRTFSFNAGCYEKIWIKNCLAIGLSSGFIEPLEATSIWQTTINLKRFFSNKNNILSNCEKDKETYNKFFLDETQEVVDIIYLHYITKNEKNDFWKNFIHNNEMPEFIKYVLEIIKHRPLTDEDFHKRNLYGFFSYFYILIGNKLITNEMLKKYYSMIKNKDLEYKQILQAQNSIIHHAIDHNKMIELIKEKM